MFTKIINLFLYAGLTKDQYKETMPTIKENNRRSLCAFSLICFAAFIATALLIHSGIMQAERSILYYSCAALCLLCYLIARFAPARLVDIPVYLFSVTLLSLSICYSTLIDPDETMSFYPVMLVIIPILFIDRPIKHLLVSWASLAAYLIIAAQTQTPEFFKHNAIHLLPTVMISSLVCIYMNALIANHQLVMNENLYLKKALQPTKKASTKNKLDDLVNLMQVIMTFHSDESLLHCKRVREYTKQLCRAYNRIHVDDQIDPDTRHLIRVGAQLHDIGKIYIPDEILHKKTPLTDEEKQVVRDHTVIGARLIDYITDICEVNSPVLHNIVLYHHERQDGNGYPEKRTGKDIPIEAQIVSLAEIYDALTSKNHSRNRSHEEAIEMILGGRCGAFSEDMRQVLKKAENDFKMILESNNDENRVDLLSSVATHNLKHYWMIKRTFDVCASLLALIVLSPLLLLIALWIKIDDPKSPVIFKQKRLGRHKVPFMMYKFRTMVPNAQQLLKELQAENEKDGPVFKIKKDPRITLPGRFLRKTSLDELPQLLNILKGEMTVVGPRPPLPSEVDQYSKYHEMRLSVTPGLTCLWQAHDNRDDISFEEWMDMDVAYIGTRNTKTDIQIIMKTILAVVRGSGN